MEECGRGCNCSISRFRTNLSFRALSFSHIEVAQENETFFLPIRRTFTHVHEWKKLQNPGIRCSSLSSSVYTLHIKSYGIGEWRKKRKKKKYHSVVNWSDEPEARMLRLSTSVLRWDLFSAHPVSLSLVWEDTPYPRAWMNPVQTHTTIPRVIAIFLYPFKWACRAESDIE